MKSRKYSNTYVFVVPTIFLWVCGQGEQDRKGLQCAQLEMKWTNISRNFSWSFIIIKKSHCAVNVIPTCLSIIIKCRIKSIWIVSVWKCINSIIQLIFNKEPLYFFNIYAQGCYVYLSPGTQSGPLIATDNRVYLNGFLK